MTKKQSPATSSKNPGKKTAVLPLFEQKESLMDDDGVMRQDPPPPENLVPPAPPTPIV